MADIMMFRYLSFGVLVQGRVLFAQVSKSNQSFYIDLGPGLILFCQVINEFGLLIVVIIFPKCAAKWSPRHCSTTMRGQPKN